MEFLGQLHIADFLLSFVLGVVRESFRFISPVLLMSVMSLSICIGLRVFVAMIYMCLL